MTTLPTNPQHAAVYLRYLKFAVERRDLSRDPGFDHGTRRYIRDRMRFWAKEAIEVRRWATGKTHPDA